MKRFFILCILIILITLIVGCEKIGYIVIIKTNRIKYDDLQQIGRTLKDKGFNTVFWERINDKSAHPDEVYTLVEKKLNDKPYYFVDVHLIYVKDLPNNIVYNLRIDINNVYKGMTVTELKDEIDKIGDLLYRELADKAGKENVVVERKAIQHGGIFLR